ncbi:5,6-dimethylbenzimidazole synthase [Variovorax paradoxus]|uniref:5,6-dimethylbenzimidazole synthase n=1 Tax=Variovorax paradoxus TaxID=34073 RepID=UPI003D65B29E
MDQKIKAQRFTDDEVAAVYRAIELRRDMRHFSGGQVPPAVLARLLRAAHLGPSVGLTQPWHFVRITDLTLRQRLAAHVGEERMATAEALSGRSDEFLRLKVEGIMEAAEVLLLLLRPDRHLHVFGRRTMPAMDLASATCAVQNMWLAARAEGIGLGWVSLFKPDEVARTINAPPNADPVAILCLGPVDAFYDEPMLQKERWERRAPLQEILSENAWAARSPLSSWLSALDATNPAD